MKPFTLITLFICLSFFATAQTTDYAKFGMDTVDLPQGLQVGETAPLFSGTDEAGNPVALETLLKKGPVVVVFYRGYWCPVCVQYLEQYNDSLQLITQRGATLIAVTTEGGEGVKKTKQKTKVKFVVLSDTDGSIARAYGVDFAVTEAYQNRIKKLLHADIAANSATGKPELPVPATYIINQQGKITYRQFDPNYKNRASVIDILNNL